jgi:dihydrofolate synthase / folylpolyglutamate synthase
MNYTQTLEYLFNSLPMFHRVGAAAYKANLDNTIRLMDLTDHPYRSFKTIHIAGTNGKGSTSHFLASILQEEGFKTGLYTSPHLKDFRERIKINGEMIPEAEVVDFVEKYKTDFEQINPSFFEMTVAMAFAYFAKEKVDVAIIETGLGGRLDSTNVITPLISVITNIGLDHTALLGDTMEKIAIEKAGIIKKDIPVVIGESDPQTDSVFIAKAAAEKAPIMFADKKYKASNVEMVNPFLMKLDVGDCHLESPLAGTYQTNNLVTVYAAVEQLNIHAEMNISPKSIIYGVKNVIKNTQLLGRWHKLNDQPLAIADTGHNPHGLVYVLKQIDCLNPKHLHFVLGMVNDKDIDTVLAMLPKTATYYFCKANIPRGMDAEELMLKAKKYQLSGTTYSSVSDAYHSALQASDAADLVFVGGSTFTVAEVL